MSLKSLALLEILIAQEAPKQNLKAVPEEDVDQEMVEEEPQGNQLLVSFVECSK